MSHSVTFSATTSCLGSTASNHRLEAKSCVQSTISPRMVIKTIQVQAIIVKVLIKSRIKKIITVDTHHTLKNFIIAIILGWERILFSTMSI